MKRKSLLIIVLIALFAPLAMNAQTDLTVCDGTTTNSYVPIYGYWADAAQHNQMIYPATDLAEMNGKVITKMVFHLASGATGNDIGNWTIKLGETDATELTGLDGTTTLTQVYSGGMVFDADAMTMTITFANDYNYNGGNLLVDFTHSAASFRSMTFYGIEATNASVNQYSSNAATVRNFLPKNTFTYEEPASCVKPTAFAATANGQSVTLTWESDATSFDVAYSTTDNIVATVSATTYTMNDLALDTDHSFYVRANCSATDQSAWTGPVSVHIGYCVPAPQSVDNNGITNVTFGVGNNVVNNSTHPTSAPYYGDYTSQIGEVQVGVEASVNITYATSYTYMTYVWVDLDNSLSFDDDEIVCSGESTNSNPTTLTLTFTIPANQTLGDYRMRIGGADSGMDDEGDPCYNGYYGIFEDYTLRVIEAPACLTPTGLALTTDGRTATATWEGTAASYNIDINGTVTNDVTSPYEFRVELSTTYTVKVQANCDGGETSDWTSAVSFTTDACLPEDMCSVTVELNDAYGDGGGQIQVVNATTNEVLATITNSGASTSQEVSACPGTQLNFVFASTDSWSYENGWVITDPAGEVISEHVGCSSSGSCDAPTAGVIATYTMNCSGCFKPSDLQVSDITTNSATMSWNGNNDSYVLQYRPWIPAGEDVQPESNVMVPVTYDLSGFTGNGSVVIRHYNCYNQFALIVDDIVVTNANGSVVFSEDFEECEGSMPSAFTNMDMDGDGHVWEIAASPNMRVNGSYGLASYSYDNDTYSVLYPNNWLIINNIPMGGTITFNYCAQDADWAAENFCVYVSTENSIVEVPVTTTSYTAENLEPNTPYAWQVKGICGDEESNFASSFFQTLNDEIVFQTAGSWNVASNWDVNRVPTTSDKVRIEAAATIPSGVVAYAKTTSIADGGSITIQDGGQLKQGTNNIDVTVQKTITGVGEDNWNENNSNGYYFIATPVGTTLFSYTSTGWGYAENLYNADGTFDLYSFDVAGDDEGNEWINYKANTDDFTKLYANQGYLYANMETTTVNFIGTTTVKSLDKIVTEDFTFDATSTDSWNGWALVGNPFTCNAYISYVDVDDNVLDADFYTLSNSNTYTLSESNVALTPCTGALINYSATGKVQFSSEAPTGNKTGRINMNLSQGRGSIDQARIRFGQGHNLQHMSFRNNSKLYMPVEGNDYAVVYTENQGEMPVSFKAEKNGTYTLSFTTEDVELGYLHLIDNLTGNDVDLLSTPSYSFEASTTDYASRFRLVFATGNASDDFAFFCNGSFVINNEGDATLQVIDITGRILSSESINGCANVNVNAAPGVYMLRLVNGDNVKVQKVVVR